MKKYHMAGPSL